jgi:putative membrane protein
MKLSTTLFIACITLFGLIFAPTSRAFADVAASDVMFVKKAASGGMAEVDAGKMAEEKGQSQDVKDFGAMMVKDHSANNEELAALAKSKDIPVPDKTDAMHQKMEDKLSGLSGAEFDKAYIAAMVKGHTKMLALMKSEESSSDSDLKAFATKTSDTVQMHLDKAKAIQASMK